MSSFDKDESWFHNHKDNSNISINIKQHIKHGHHRAKFTFSDDPVSIKQQKILNCQNLY